MQTFNSLTFYVNPFNTKRGSTHFANDISPSTIGTQQLYCEIHSLLDDFSNFIKSSEMTIDIFNDFSSKLARILYNNDIKSINDGKILYNNLFLKNFKNSSFNAKHHNLYKFRNRVFGTIGTVICVATLPVVLYTTLSLYLEDEDFKEYMDNIKNDRVFTLKKLLYLMALMNGIFTQDGIKTKNEKNQYIVSLLNKKNPYGDLYDFIESNKLYSAYYSDELETDDESSMI